MMTMFASKTNVPGKPPSPNIRVSITYGPVTATVDEHYSHLRNFHTQLGQLLYQVELEQSNQQEVK